MMEEAFAKELSILNSYDVVSELFNGIEYEDDLFGFWKVDMLAEAMFQLKLSPEKLHIFLAWFKYLEKCIEWSKKCDRKKLFSELCKLFLRYSNYFHLQLPQPPQSFLPCIPESITTAQIPSKSSVNQMQTSSEAMKGSNDQLKTSHMSVDQLWKAPTPTASFDVMRTASTTTKQSADQITPKYSAHLMEATSTTKPVSTSKIYFEQMPTAPSKTISISTKDSGNIHIPKSLHKSLNQISQSLSIIRESKVDMKEYQSSMKASQQKLTKSEDEKLQDDPITNSMLFQEMEQLHTTMRHNSKNKETNLQDFVNIMEVLYSIFANPFCFELLKLILHRTEKVSTIPLPYSINLPMTLAPPPPPEETSQPTGKKKGKDSKGKKKSKDVEKQEKKSKDKGKKDKGKQDKGKKDQDKEDQDNKDKGKKEKGKEKKGKDKKEKENKGKEKKEKGKKGEEKKGKEKKGKEKKGKEKKGKENKAEEKKSITIITEQEEEVVVVEAEEFTEPLIEEPPPESKLPKFPPESKPEPPEKSPYLQPLKAAVNDEFFEVLFKEEIKAMESKKKEKDKSGKKQKGSKGDKKKGK